MSPVHLANEFLCIFLFLSLSLFPVEFTATQTFTPTFSLKTRRGGNSLGLGDEQRVGEEEEMPLLGLQARLQLRLGVAQEEATRTLGQEGLDQGTGLWADWRQAAFSVGQKRDETPLISIIMSCLGRISCELQHWMPEEWAALLTVIDLWLLICMADSYHAIEQPGRLSLVGFSHHALIHSSHMLAHDSPAVIGHIGPQRRTLIFTALCLPVYTKSRSHDKVTLHLFTWNVPNRWFFSIPHFSQCFAAPVPTCSTSEDSFCAFIDRNQSSKSSIHPVLFVCNHLCIHFNRWCGMRLAHHCVLFL